MRAGPRAIVVVIALVTAGSCAGIGPGQRVDRTQVRLADLGFAEIGLFEQRFRMTLRIGNPNDFALPIDGLRYTLEVNDRAFASGLSNRSLTVPRLGEATVEVEASTTLLDVVGQFMALSSREALSYRMIGTAFLRGVARREVPFEQSGSFRMAPGARAASPRPDNVGPTANRESL
jgi:LEA14-like dessication related protein